MRRKGGLPFYFVRQLLARPADDEADQQNQEDVRAESREAAIR